LLCDNTDLSTFVFTGATGRPLDYSHTRARIWLPALQRARLPDPAPTWHDLRHSYATWLIAGGADVGTVRDVLGHESLVVTNRYTHARPDAAAAVLRALSR
jgi:integrase